MQGRGGTHKNHNPLPSETAGNEASVAVTRAVRPLAAARAVFATQSIGPFLHEKAFGCFDF